jgi:hypothetical protein
MYGGGGPSFRRFRVYTPAPIAEEVVLPSCATNIVLPSPLPLALWEQLTLLRAHGHRGLLFCPSYVIPVLARCPTFLIYHGSYEGYPQAFDWWTRNKARAAYSLSAKQATVVCTVSEYSKRDMVRLSNETGRRHVVRRASIRSCPPDTGIERLAQWRVKTFGSVCLYHLSGNR